MKHILLVMTEGYIKFYNRTSHWGFVTSQDGEFFFSISDVSDEVMALLETNHFQDEPILFEIIPSTKKPGEKQASGLTIDFSKRSIGHLVFQERDGEKFPYVKEITTGKEYALAVSKMKTAPSRYVNFEERDGDPVIFTPQENYATRFEFIDNRRNILSFADFSRKERSVIDPQKYEWVPSHKGYILALQELKTRFCNDESWDYIQKKTEEIPILCSYMDQTCKRILEEDKLVLGYSSAGKEYAYFNTGLADNFQSEVFAYFEKNHNYKEVGNWGISIPKWHFLEFNTEESRYRRYFDGRATAEIASYFNPGTQLVLDPEDLKTAKPNWDHLFDRKMRIAEENINAMSEMDFRDAINDSIDLAYRRIKRNYKTAIPQFYSHEIQFLVPLYSRKDRANALAAMVIRKNESIYEISTILTLDQAYNNARLLAKPDREWLNP